MGRFWYSSEFGFYEDDHGRVVPAINSTWQMVWHHVSSMFTQLGDQGRLFHHNFIYLFSWVGHKLGGVAGLYWTAFGVAAVNTGLFYLLLRRVSTSAAFVAAATVAYALFPADTTVAYLTISFGGQPSLTFFLLASYCYLKSRERRWWLAPAYLLLFCSLTTYETVVPLFLAVPLLGANWNRKLAWEVVRNGLILGAMITAAYFIRRSMGEGFVSGLDFGTVLTWPFQQMLLGPLTCFGTFVSRPFEAWWDHTTELAVFLLLAFAGLFLLFGRIAATSEPAQHFWRETGKLAAVGLMLMVLAYPLAFTTPADQTNGRSTRVHLPAVVGTSLVAGAIFSGLTRARRSSRVTKQLVAGLFAMVLAGQLGFGVIVQKDYRYAWRLQQALWRDVVKQCPDLEDNTVVLLSPEGLLEATHILAWGWALSHTLRDLYRFPSDYENPPLFYRMVLQWRERVAASGNLRDGIDPVGCRIEARPDAKVILLNLENGRAVRQTGTLVIGDHEFPLKELPSTNLPQLEKQLFYHYTIAEPLPEPVTYAR